MLALPGRCRASVVFPAPVQCSRGACSLIGVWSSTGMASNKLAWLALAPGWALIVTASAAAQSANARLGTYEKEGHEYFALSLLPQVAADPSQQNEVVVLVDTSASQTGRYRSEELSALQSLLATLTPRDRVQLMAVDMKATPMSAGFVAPQGPEMQAALAKLNARTPLGATDLESGLRTAAGSFANSGAARTVIDIGDAMSKANFPTGPAMQALVSELRSGHVTVSSYVLGQERNVPLMAALANQTGGMVEVARADADASATSGRLLAAAVNGSVVWPSDAS